MQEAPVKQKPWNLKMHLMAGRKPVKVEAVKGVSEAMPHVSGDDSKQSAREFSTVTLPLSGSFTGK